jgi:hypothetical protein
MKIFLMTILVVTFVGVCFPYISYSQTHSDKAAKQNEETRKRAEKIRKNVVKLGTGEATKIEVKLFDNKTYVGYIKEANDKSFIVIDKTNAPHEFVYGDVQSVHNAKESSRSKTAGHIILGAAIGIGAVIIIALVSYFKGVS